jgi:hypothetical protein
MADVQSCERFQTLGKAIQTAQREECVWQVAALDVAYPRELATWRATCHRDHAAMSR